MTPSGAVTACSERYMLALHGLAKLLLSGSGRASCLSVQAVLFMWVLGEQAHSVTVLCSESFLALGSSLSLIIGWCNLKLPASSDALRDHFLPENTQSGWITPACIAYKHTTDAVAQPYCCRVISLRFRVLCCSQV